ncbi:MAG: HAMP domain-containing sensor histidine kinase [Vicinamibacterales bacterium]|nr:HAMP domain-containing sensor histidine kinase [Vicinamibacterales bacterium]
MADFLSSLVHELRTPLTALRGSLGLLNSESADANAVREFSGIALRNASRLAGLLDDVAVYARLLDPGCQVSLGRVDLSLLLEDAASRVQPFAEERGVTVEAQLVAFDTFADETLLRDAVARVMRYAVRVTPRNGAVRLGAEVVAGRVVVRVADQGKPVAEGDYDDVFEPFNSAARRGDAGDRVSLDLAIARAVAERHDGNIEYRQITGGGVVRITVGAVST